MSIVDLVVCLFRSFGGDTRFRLDERFGDDNNDLIPKDKLNETEWEEPKTVAPEQVDELQQALRSEKKLALSLLDSIVPHTNKQTLNISSTTTTTTTTSSSTSATSISTSASSSLAAHFDSIDEVTEENKKNAWMWKPMARYDPTTAMEVEKAKAAEIQAKKEREEAKKQAAAAKEAQEQKQVEEQKRVEEEKERQEAAARSEADIYQVNVPSLRNLIIGAAEPVSFSFSFNPSADGVKSFADTEAAQLLSFNDDEEQQDQEPELEVTIQEQPKKAEKPTPAKAASKKSSSTPAKPVKPSQPTVVSSSPSLSSTPAPLFNPLFL